MADRSLPHIQIDVPYEQVADFCRRNHIRKLSLFGSVLRDDFNDESDVDVLVEFQFGAKVGLFDLARMARELSSLFHRQVDLLTPGFLSLQFRKAVLEGAETIYEKAS